MRPYAPAALVLSSSVCGIVRLEIGRKTVPALRRTDGPRLLTSPVNPLVGYLHQTFEVTYVANVILKVLLRFTLEAGQADEIFYRYYGRSGI
jgi:hypothetical protein